MNARLRRLLILMYPKTWRRRYGAEFDELLIATAMTPAVLFDVVGHAAIERIRRLLYYRRMLAALACFAALDAIAVRMRITTNIFWAPTTPARAIMLMITFAPLAVVATAFHKSLFRSD